MENKITYSVLIPVYNAEKSLEELYRRLRKVFKNITEDYEILFVDDCSVDNSWNILTKLRDEDKRVKLIHLLRNFGQHNAIMCGLNHVRGEYTILMDDDLQNPPEEVPRLIDKIKEGYLAVFGVPVQKEHSVFRNFLSRRFQNLNRRIMKIPKHIDITSFAIMKREVVDHMITIKSSYPMFAAYIFYTTPVSKITNVEVQHDERKHGKSNYNFFRIFKFSLNLLINFSSLPLLLVGLFGIIISLASISYGLIILIRKIIDPGYGLTGWNSTMVAITFLGGAILLAIGIIGEYLRRILREVSYGKQYIIGEKRL